ncbi:MAG: hypothetical protein ACI87O_000204 [Planctomycetota bacterium]|jgi:hypothetical protein
MESTPVISPRIFLILAAVFCIGAPGAFAQKGRNKLPKTDPSQCPYCHGDKDIMRAAGIVSHGGFTVGRKTTAEVDKELGTAEIYWIETEHFEIGMALGRMKVKQEDKKKIRDEYALLGEHLEDVPEKPKVLDQWGLAHLYAQRLEAMYTNMLTLMELEDSVFPPPGTVWNMQGEYWGQGPYFGQKGKLEVLLLPSESLHVAWLSKNFGLRTKNSQRWHIIDSGSLHLCVHVEQGSLKVDAALHGHLAFNISIMLVNSFKHYSYDMPVWLLEGIGHYMERRLNPKYNTFDSGEGGVAQTTKKKNWEPVVKKLVSGDKATNLAELTRMTNFAELDLNRHFVSWSLVDYLQRAHPGFLRTLIFRTANLRNEQNLPDGTNLMDEHRSVFKDELKMSYLAFDRAWREWVLENYTSK